MRCRSEYLCHSERFGYVVVDITCVLLIEDKKKRLW